MSIQKILTALLITGIIATSCCSCADSTVSQNIGGDTSTLTSTQFEEKYDVKLYSPYLVSDMIDYKSDSDFVNQDANAHFDPQSIKTINFEGKEYNVSFIEQDNMYMSDYHRYEYSSDEDTTFILDSITKNICMYFVGSDVYPTNEVSDIGSEKRQEIAQQIAEKYIDVSKYNLEIEELINNNSKSDYAYTYSRYYGDIKAREYLYVRLSCSGDYYCLQTCNLGRFDEHSTDGFDMTAINEMAKNKINSLIDSLENSSKYNNAEISNTWLSKIKGKNAIVVEFAYENNTDPNYTSHENVAVIVTLK